MNSFPFALNSANTREQVKALRDMNKILQNMNNTTSGIQTSPMRSPSHPIPTFSSSPPQRDFANIASLGADNTKSPQGSSLFTPRSPIATILLPDGTSFSPRSPAVNIDPDSDPVILKEKLDNLKRDNDKKREHNEKLKEEINEMEEEILSLHKQQKNYEETISGLRETVKSREQVSREFQTEAQEKQHEVDRLMKRFQEMEMDQEDTLTRLRDAEELATITSNDLGSIRLENINLSERIQQLTHEKIQIHEQMQKLTQKHQEEIHALTEECDRAKRVLVELKGSYNQTSLTVSEKQTALDLQHKQVEDLLEQISVLGKQVQSLMAEKQLLEEQMESHKTNTRTRIEEFESSNNELKARNEELEKQISDLRTENQEIMDNYTHNREKLSSTTVQFTDLSMFNEQLKLRNITLNEQLESARKESASLALELKGAMEEISKKSKEMEENATSFTKELQQLQIQTTGLEERIVEYDKMIKVEKRRTMECKETIRELRSELEQMNEKAIQKAQDREAERKQLETFINNLKSDNENLRNSFNINKLENEDKLTEAELKYQYFQNVISSLNNEIQEERENHNRIEIEKSNEIASLKNEKLSLELHIQTIKANLKEVTEISREREVSLAKEKHRLEAELRSLTEQTASLKNHNEQLQETSNYNQKQIKRLQTEADTEIKTIRSKLEAQIDGLLVAKRKSDNRLKQAREYVSDLKDQVREEMKRVKSVIDERDSKIQSLHRQIESVSSQVSMINPIVTQLYAEYSSLEDQLSKVEEYSNEQSKQLFIELDSLCKENSSLKMKYNQSCLDQEKQEAKIKELKLQKEELKASRDEAEKSASSLKIQYKCLQEKMDMTVDDLMRDFESKNSLNMSREKALQERCDALRAEVEQLQAQYDSLKKQKQEVAKSNELLMKQIKQIQYSSEEEGKNKKTTITKLNNSNQLLNEQLQSLQSKYESETKSLQEHVTQQKEKITRLTDHLENVKREKDEAQLTFTQQELQYKNNIAEINNQFEVILEAIKTNEKSLNEDKYRLELEIQGKNQRISNLENEIDSVKREKENGKHIANQEKEELLGQVRRLERAKYQADQRQETLNKDIASISEQCQQLRNELESSIQEKLQLCTQIQNLKEEIENSRLAYSQQEKQLRRNLDHLQEHLRKTENEMRITLEQKRNLQLEYASLTDKLGSIGTQTDKNIADLKEENNKLRTALQQNQESMTNQKRTLDVQISHMKNELLTVKSKYQQLQTEYQTAKYRTNSNSEYEISNLSTQLQKSEEIIRDLSLANAELQDELTRLNNNNLGRNRMRLIEQEMDNIRTEKMHLEEHVRLLKNQLANAQEESEKWRKKFEQCVIEKRHSAAADISKK